MFRQLVFAATILCAATPAYSQTTPISIVNGTYFEDFNSMGTGSPTYPTGWNGFKIAGTGANLAAGAFITTSTNPAFTTNNGSSATGTVYNFGTTGNSDRALGTVASGPTIAGFGVVLVNTTGRVLTEVDVEMSFRVEQWRTGNNAEVETWTFQWATGGPTLDVNDMASVFQPDAAFNITEILTGDNSNVAVDGNANFLNMGPGPPFDLIWNPGDRLVLRWLDSNNTGNDGGMAIDDFRFTVFNPVPEPATLVLCGLALGGWVLIRRRNQAG